VAWAGDWGSYFSGMRASTRDISGTTNQHNFLGSALQGVASVPEPGCITLPREFDRDQTFTRLPFPSPKTILQAGLDTAPIISRGLRREIPIAPGDSALPA